MRGLCSIAALLVWLATVSSPLPGLAAIQSYQLGKTELYDQTSSAQPVNLASAEGIGDIAFSVPADIQTASLTRSGSASFPIALSLTASDRFSFIKTYPTLAALNVDFPANTTFTYSISGGTLGSKTATISLNSQDLYPSSVPFFSGTSFAQLQAFHADASHSLTISGVTQLGGNTTTFALVSIKRLSDQAIVFSQFIQNPGVNSSLVTVPANTLSPGTAYNAAVDVATFVSAQGQGFTGAAELTYEKEADVAFTTVGVPEPSSLALAAFGLVGSALYGWRKRRS